MAIYATFNGVNASGYTDSWGLRFVTGEEVLVEDAEAVSAIKRHPEFSYREKKSSVDVPLADLDKFDHDGGGKPGGSKPRKAKAKK